MKPPAFEYIDPQSIGEVVNLLEENEFDAKVLSGGQSLMPLLNMRLARPSLVIDLAKIPDLDFVRENDGVLEIGAMTRQRSLEFSDLVREQFPLLHAGTMHIAHPQNRNQGTVGGSIAHADPAAELPALAVALDAEFTAVGPDGERTIGVDEFFLTYLTTSLEPAEVLTQIRIPKWVDGTGWSIQEVARRHGDFALAGVVSTLRIDSSGVCSNARIVLFGVGEKPIRAEAAEQMLKGERPSESAFRAAAERAAADLDEPLSDVHATSELRRSVAGVMARRALTEAHSRVA